MLLRGRPSVFVRLAAGKVARGRRRLVDVCNVGTQMSWIFAKETGIWGEVVMLKTRSHIERVLLLEFTRNLPRTTIMAD